MSIWRAEPEIDGQLTGPLEKPTTDRSGGISGHGGQPPLRDCEKLTHLPFPELGLCASPVFDQRPACKTQQMGLCGSMAGTIFRIGAIQIFIAAEDHPPPHVHARHTTQGWVARFRFSFLSDVAALYRFKQRGRNPTVQTLDELEEAIVRTLPDCRAEWWATHGDRHGIGLVNRCIVTRPDANADGVLAKVPLKPDRGAATVAAATYDPGAGGVTLTLADGQQLSLTSGLHIEEAEEWCGQ